MYRVTSVVARTARTGSNTTRFFATETQLSAASGKSAGELASAAPLPSVQAAPVARPVVVKSSSFTDRLLTFMAGLGVGGVIGYYKLTEDIWESTAEVE